MAEKAGVFDGQAFYQAIDAERLSRGLNWKQVAQESGVSASTLTRLGQDRKPDVDSMSALISWSGLDTRDFIRTQRKASASGFSQSVALLRSDPHLRPESATALEEVLKAAYELFRDK